MSVLSLSSAGSARARHSSRRATAWRDRPPCRATGRSSPSPSPAFAAGFTLVEAAVTLVVLALLATLAWPSVQSMIDAHRLDGAARQLAAHLQLARFEALGRSEAVQLSVFDADGGGSCYLVHTGPRDACSCATGCSGAAAQLERVELPAAGRLRLAAPVGSLRFDPQLGTCTPAGTLALSTPGGQSVHHIVNVLGRVRSCSPGARASGYPSCS